jgi:hypothetical protein
MAGLLSSVGFIRGCGVVSAFGMTPVAIMPAAHNISGEGKTMHAATKRAVIAAAGLAAAGLLGSLPYDGSPLAQQAAPVRHHDVALVDVTDATLLLDEGTFDNAFFNDVLGPTGAEEQLFTALATATNTSEATTLLDATGATPIYAGDFNGAESRAFEALFLDGLVAQDQVNQLVGVTDTASQSELLTIFTADFVPIPASAGITATDLASAVGTSAFDTDLTTIANADYALAASDFEGYLTSLAGDTSGLGDFSTLLTDLSASFSDLSTNLTTDFGTVITDVTSLLSGGLDLGSILGSL